MLYEVITDFVVEDTKAIENNFQNVVGQDSLNRFDKPKKRPNKNKKRRNTSNNKPQQQKPANKKNAPKKN